MERIFRGAHAPRVLEETLSSALDHDVCAKLTTLADSKRHVDEFLNGDAAKHAGRGIGRL